MQRSLAEWVGQACWSVMAGAGTGSNFAIEAGERIPLRRRLTNTRLTEEERSYRGMFSLYVTSAWRLQQRSRVVCTWNDTADDPSFVYRVLRSLVGHTVTDARGIGNTFDLAIEFDDETQLVIFCDQGTKESQACFSFTTDGGATTIVANDAFRVSVEHASRSH